MDRSPLSLEERTILLRLARQSLEDFLCRGTLQPLVLSALPERLQQPGVTFVTLTRRGKLRGCVGALEPYQPLAEDVREHALGAALRDLRFPPVQPQELAEIKIEISSLTPAQPLKYDCPEELLARLRPGIDGVILQDGVYRATFLPQVWEKLPDPVDFLSYLCQKMGANPLLWRVKILQVHTYQVESFEEE